MNAKGQPIRLAFLHRGASRRARATRVCIRRASMLWDQGACGKVSTPLCVRRESDTTFPVPSRAKANRIRPLLADTGVDSNKPGPTGSSRSTAPVGPQLMCLRWTHEGRSSRRRRSLALGGAADVVATEARDGEQKTVAGRAMKGAIIQ
jgi:hypothetical protein